jgi:DNA-binding NarL/FixJ family response regulator
MTRSGRSVIFERAAFALLEDMLRVFLDEGTLLETVLRTLPGDPARDRVLTALVAQHTTRNVLCGAATTPLMARPPAQGLVEPFSEREQEVLRLVAAGLSRLSPIPRTQ